MKKFVTGVILFSCMVFIVSGCSNTPAQTGTAKKVTATEVWAFTFDGNGQNSFTVNMYDDNSITVTGVITNDNTIMPYYGSPLKKNGINVTIAASGTATYIPSATTSSFTNLISGTISSSSSGSGSYIVGFASWPTSGNSGTWTASYVSGGGIFH